MHIRKEIFIGSLVVLFLFSPSAQAGGGGGSCKPGNFSSHLYNVQLTDINSKNKNISGNITFPETLIGPITFDASKAKITDYKNKQVKFDYVHVDDNLTVFGEFAIVCKGRKWLAPRQVGIFIRDERPTYPLIATDKGLITSINAGEIVVGELRMTYDPSTLVEIYNYDNEEYLRAATLQELAAGDNIIFELVIPYPGATPIVTKIKKFVR